MTLLGIFLLLFLPGDALDKQAEQSPAHHMLNQRTLTPMEQFQVGEQARRLKEMEPQARKRPLADMEGQIDAKKRARVMDNRQGALISSPGNNRLAVRQNDQSKEDRNRRDRQIAISHINDICTKFPGVIQCDKSPQASNNKAVRVPSHDALFRDIQRHYHVSYGSFGVVVFAKILGGGLKNHNNRYKVYNNCIVRKSEQDPSLLQLLNEHAELNCGTEHEVHSESIDVVIKVYKGTPSTYTWRSLLNGANNFHNKNQRIMMPELKEGASDDIWNAEKKSHLLFAFRKLGSSQIKVVNHNHGTELQLPGNAYIQSKIKGVSLAQALTNSFNQAVYVLSKESFEEKHLVAAVFIEQFSTLLLNYATATLRLNQFESLTHCDLHPENILINLKHHVIAPGEQAPSQKSGLTRYGMLPFNLQDTQNNVISTLKKTKDFMTGICPFDSGCYVIDLTEEFNNNLISEKTDLSLDRNDLSNLTILDVTYVRPVYSNEEINPCLFNPVSKRLEDSVEFVKYCSKYLQTGTEKNQNLIRLKEYKDPPLSNLYDFFNNWRSDVNNCAVPGRFVFRSLPQHLTNMDIPPQKNKEFHDLISGGANGISKARTYVKNHLQTLMLEPCTTRYQIQFLRKVVKNLRYYICTPLHNYFKMNKMPPNSHQFAHETLCTNETVVIEKSELYNRNNNGAKVEQEQKFHSNKLNQSSSIKDTNWTNENINIINTEIINNNINSETTKLNDHNTVVDWTEEGFKQISKTKYELMTLPLNNFEFRHLTLSSTGKVLLTEPSEIELGQMFDIVKTNSLEFLASTKFGLFNFGYNALVLNPNKAINKWQRFSTNNLVFNGLTPPGSEYVFYPTDDNIEYLSFAKLNSLLLGEYDYVLKNNANLQNTLYNILHRYKLHNLSIISILNTLIEMLTQKLHPVQHCNLKADNIYFRKTIKTQYETRQENATDTEVVVINETGIRNYSSNKNISRGMRKDATAYDMNNHIILVHNENAVTYYSELEQYLEKIVSIGSNPISNDNNNTESSPTKSGTTVLDNLDYTEVCHYVANHNIYSGSNTKQILSDVSAMKLILIDIHDGDAKLKNIVRRFEQKLENWGPKLYTIINSRMALIEKFTSLLSKQTASEREQLVLHHRSYHSNDNNKSKYLRGKRKTQPHHNTQMEQTNQLVIIFNTFKEELIDYNAMLTNTIKEQDGY